jgi:hypothetical protein
MVQIIMFHHLQIQLTLLALFVINIIIYMWKMQAQLVIPNVKQVVNAMVEENAVKDVAQDGQELHKI